MKKITKLFTTKATSIDEKTKTVRFKISDNKPDRMGEIVDQRSWQLESYNQNPIVLWGHNSDEPENVLGRAVVTAGMDESYADITLDDDINPKAALIWKQILKGTLRCVSVGFIPHTTEFQDDTPVLKDNELLEISIVPIPANPRAIALSYKAGEISKKDAQFLQESMRKELEFIDQQLKESPGDEETKDMEEIKTQLAQVLDVVGKLGETMETKFAEIDTRLAEVKPVENTETEEEKAAREAQEAEDAKASANDGEHDQSGADDNEIDLEAELTPELEAQIEAELAEVA